MKAWVRHRFPELVALFVAVGFFLTGVELLLMDHTEGIQILAPLTAFAGALLVGLGLLLRRWGFALALFLLAPLGLFGFWQHLEEGLEAGVPGTYRWVDEEGEAWEEDGKNAPPPLAPLSLSGLALLGALGLYAREE